MHAKFLLDNGAVIPPVPQARVPGTHAKTGKAEQLWLKSRHAEQRALEERVDIGDTVKNMFAREEGGKDLSWGEFFNTFIGPKYTTGKGFHGDIYPKP